VVSRRHGGAGTVRRTPWSTTKPSRRTYVAWTRLRDPAKAETHTRKAITTTAITWFRRKSWNNERATETLPEPGDGAAHCLRGLGFV